VTLEFAFANSDRLSPPKVEAGWAGVPIPLLCPTGLVTWAALRGGWGVSPFGRAKLQQLLTGQEKSQCGPGRARIVFTPDRIRNLGRPEATLWSLDSLGVRVRELQQALTAGSRSGMDTHAHPASTPYWITFELRSIDVKAASVGILDQMVAGLR
jgi:hypothetical protein